jgi:hypothetical protein
MYGRFSTLNYNWFSGNALEATGGAGTEASGLSYNIAAAGTYTISPNFVVDANFGFNKFNTVDRRSADAPGPDRTRLPGIIGRSDGEAVLHPHGLAVNLDFRGTSKSDWFVVKSQEAARARNWHSPLGGLLAYFKVVSPSES